MSKVVYKKLSCSVMQTIALYMPVKLDAIQCDQHVSVIITFFAIFDDTSLWILPKIHDPSLCDAHNES